MTIRLLAAALLASLLAGCVTYRDFPQEMVGKPPAAKPYAQMYYNIPAFGALSIGDGESHLRRIFREKTPFQTAEINDQVPARGVYTQVTVEYKPPHLPAIAFGYLSISALGLLPAWSEHDGYFINYTVYVDGDRKKAYQYEITRKAAIWLGLLPVVWVNAMTYDEAEAVEATAYQFFRDADPLFAAARDGLPIPSAPAPAVPPQG